MKLNFHTLSVVARKQANIDGIVTILIEIGSKGQKSPSFEKVFYEGSQTKEIKLILKKSPNEDNLHDDVVIIVRKKPAIFHIHKDHK